tara:strand:+ start:439 stop:666 length:228 start_codon:yes stop_codon:yes gene_type:complete
MKSNIVWNRALEMSNKYRQGLGKLSLEMMDEYPDIDVHALITIQLCTCVEAYRQMEDARKERFLDAAAKAWEITS